MSAGGTPYVFRGPLLWLGARLGRNRERAGIHYPSDSLASRWLAGAIWKLVVTTKVTATSDATPPGAPPVTDSNLIVCPTLRRVLHLAKAEWA
jgi:hypothetical protein